MNYQSKRFADRVARTASEAVEKGSFSAERSASGVEQSCFAAVEGVRDFNVSLISR
jgi:hypothetical protein